MYKKYAFSIPEILENLKIKELNTMQLSATEEFEKHNNLILLSPTGSGKTLAFLLCILNTFQVDTKGIQAVIITPTRELALQIEQVFKSLKTPFKVNTCYGGHDIKIEENNLSQPPTLLVGTPGRICDHISRGNLDYENANALVLDEFDKSLEMGFQEEMSFIISKLTNIKNKILTSATNISQIPTFVGMNQSFTIDLLSNQKSALEVFYLKANRESKQELLLNLLFQIGNESVIVFCNQRDKAEQLSVFLTENEIINNYFHGGLEQNYRESTIVKFRNGSNKILITTDLAARGLDIPDVKFVVHFELPQKEDGYVHRNGRTARMTANGIAILILDKNDYLPEFVHPQLPIFKLSEKLQKLQKPFWETLFIGGGKKEKINKIDVVGFLSKVGELSKDELGLIEIKDHYSYAAVKREIIKSVIQKVRNEKIKGKKFKIEIARENPI